MLSAQEGDVDTVSGKATQPQQPFDAGHAGAADHHREAVRAH